MIDVFCYLSFACLSSKNDHQGTFKTYTNLKDIKPLVKENE